MKVFEPHLDEAGLQPAKVTRGDEPRALPWAGMKDTFGVGLEDSFWCRLEDSFWCRVGGQLLVSGRCRVKHHSSFLFDPSVELS